MSGAQEERARRIVAEMERDALAMRAEITSLEAQLEDKRKALAAHESQIRAIKYSDSY